MATWRLEHGDCLDVLRAMPDASVDAVVTDPPYELGFMGRAWDASGIAYSVPLWREVLRVLRPGGHLLAFGGTRTYHRMTCAIEDAGFEVRDCLAWLYGSGFPKSLDVSKAINKAAGAERQVVGARTLSDRAAQKGGTYTVGAPSSAGLSKDVPITAPATDAARQWQGWGTALKPAHEPIVLARKPLAGTVAANVLAHGVGGINVDGCRIGAESTRRDTGTAAVWGNAGRIVGGSDAGRWPANVLLGCACESETHDAGCAVRVLDEQSGTRKAGGAIRTKKQGFANGSYSQRGQGAQSFAGYDDTGTASRFFYVAKASQAERSDGLDTRSSHPTVKPIELMRHLVRLVTPPGGTVLDPFAGSGSTLVAALAEGFSCIGIEREEEYVAIARARVEHAEWAAVASLKPKLKPKPKACAVRLRTKQPTASDVQPRTQMHLFGD